MPCLIRYHSVKEVLLVDNTDLKVKKIFKKTEGINTTNLVIETISIVSSLNGIFKNYCTN